MRLRSALGPAGHRLQGNRGSYVLEVHPGEVDAEVFGTHFARAQKASRASDWEAVGAATSAALLLWRGRPLTEYPALHGAPEVTHLVEQHLQAVEIVSYLVRRAIRARQRDLRRHPYASGSGSVLWYRSQIWALR